jgi:hypothetical protein
MKKEKERQDALNKFKNKFKATNARRAAQSAELAKNSKESKALDEAQEKAKTAASGFIKGQFK